MSGDERPTFVGRTQMDEHSGQQMTYWQARRRRRELRNGLAGEGATYRPRKKRYRLIIILLVLISVGCVLGFYAKPIGKLAAKVYLLQAEQVTHFGQRRGQGAELPYSALFG